MNWFINITFSKLTAIIILVMAFVLEFRCKTGGAIFQFALPFVVVLVTGKQFFDSRKEIKKDEKV